MCSAHRFALPSAHDCASSENFGSDTRARAWRARGARARTSAACDFARHGAAPACVAAVPLPLAIATTSAAATAAEPTSISRYPGRNTVSMACDTEASPLEHSASQSCASSLSKGPSPQAPAQAERHTTSASAATPTFLRYFTPSSLSSIATGGDTAVGTGHARQDSEPTPNVCYWPAAEVRLRHLSPRQRFLHGGKVEPGGIALDARVLLVPVLLVKRGRLPLEGLEPGVLGTQLVGPPLRFSE